MVEKKTKITDKNKSTEEDKLYMIVYSVTSLCKIPTHCGQISIHLLQYFILIHYFQSHVIFCYSLLEVVSVEYLLILI